MNTGHLKTIADGYKIMDSSKAEHDFYLRLKLSILQRMNVLSPLQKNKSFSLIILR